MVIHCYDFVQGQRECDLGSQWSGWGGSHIFPQDLAAAFLQVHPCWFAFREPVNYLGVGCVCVCVGGVVFTSMEKKCGDANTLLLELPFLKLLCPKEFSMCAGGRTSVCRNGVSPVGVGHSHQASLGQPQLPHQPPRGDRDTAGVCV